MLLPHSQRVRLGLRYSESPVLAPSPLLPAGLLRVHRAQSPRARGIAWREPRVSPGEESSSVALSAGFDLPLLFNLSVCVHVRRQ